MVISEIEEFLAESNKIEGVYDQKSHKTALTAWEFLLQFDNLTQTNILDTHRILMDGKIEPGEGLGTFRRVDVYISNRKGLAPYLLADALHKWIEESMKVVKNSINMTTSPYVKGRLSAFCKSQHVQFERIHPFIDGNGRMGRILLNWMRNKMNLPTLVILETERQSYYNWFKEIDLSQI